MKVKFCSLFNHRFEDNIPKLNKIYKDRFSNYSIIMPFYSGNDSDVISVKGNSYLFQDFISQSFEKIYDSKIDFYVFCSDDLILNPLISEDNIIDYLNLNTGMAFINDLQPLSKMGILWQHTMPAVHKLSTYQGLNWETLVPPPEELLSRETYKGFDFNREGFLKLSEIKKLKDRRYRHTLIKALAYAIWSTRITSNYPVLAGYSDFLIIPSKGIIEFCYYCGVFAALGLFAEIAIPSALMMSCGLVKTIKETGLYSIPFWYKDKKKIYPISEMVNIDEVMGIFVKDLLFIHPVKLSRIYV